MNYDKIAQKLDNAAYICEAIDQISNLNKLELTEAYLVQAKSIDLRHERGEKFVGLKMGFTSKAKMEQMNVHELIWGRLTDKMLIEEGASISLSSYIHPRAEPEIAFLLNDKELTEFSVESVKEKVDSVAVAIEVIDSRYKNFKFSLEDVIADNCSSSGYALGKWHPSISNIQDISIGLSINGSNVHEGNSNAILGNPWDSLVSALRLADANKVNLKAGHIILAGAATPAVYLKPDDVVMASAEGLGSVSFSVKSNKV